MRKDNDTSVVLLMDYIQMTHCFLQELKEATLKTFIIVTVLKSDIIIKKCDGLMILFNN